MEIDAYGEDGHDRFDVRVWNTSGVYGFYRIWGGNGYDIAEKTSNVSIWLFDVEDVITVL